MRTYLVTIDTSAQYRMVRTDSIERAAQLAITSVNVGMHREGVIDLLREGESVRFKNEGCSDIVDVEIEH